MKKQMILASIVSGLMILAPVAKADDAHKAPAAEKHAKAKHTSCECGDCKKGKCEKKKCEHCEHHAADAHHAEEGKQEAAPAAGEEKKQ